MKKTCTMMSSLLVFALSVCCVFGFPSFSYPSSLSQGVYVDLEHGQTQALIAQKTIGYDPLRGLVAEDILTKFRRNYSAGTNMELGDAVYDEAMVLGRWIKRDYGRYFSSSIYSQSASIGNRYEWFFGTDISNNFENNFAYIYAAYFGLKNYYTNGGSSAVYGMLASDYADFYSYAGAGAAIQQMYEELQNFVTDCNNVVRMYG